MVHKTVPVGEMKIRGGEIKSFTCRAEADLKVSICAKEGMM